MRPTHLRPKFPHATRHPVGVIIQLRRVGQRDDIVRRRPRETAHVQFLSAGDDLEHVLDTLLVGGIELFEHGQRLLVTFQQSSFSRRTLVLRQRTSEAETMITNLATFFRSSLTADPAADVSLADEIDMQRLYLDIERVRFPERLSVLIDVPEDAKQARVPGMILQPLDIGIQGGLVQSMVKPVMSKRDFVHVFVEGLLFGAKENHSWV